MAYDNNTINTSGRWSFIRITSFAQQLNNHCVVRYAALSRIDTTTTAENIKFDYTPGTTPGAKSSAWDRMLHMLQLYRNLWVYVVCEPCVAKNPTHSYLVYRMKLLKYAFANSKRTQELVQLQLPSCCPIQCVTLRQRSMLTETPTCLAKHCLLQEGRQAGRPSPASMNTNKDRAL